MRLKAAAARAKGALGILAFMKPKALQEAIIANQPYMTTRYTMKKQRATQQEFLYCCVRRAVSHYF